MVFLLGRTEHAGSCRCPEKRFSAATRTSKPKISDQLFRDQGREFSDQKIVRFVLVVRMSLFTGPVLMDFVPLGFL